MSGGRPRVRIIGGGRAGGSFAAALSAADWDVVELLGSGDDPGRSGDGVDLVLLAVPDRLVPAVSASVGVSGAVVCHLAGSLGLEVLEPHPRRAAIHPLVSLPSAEVGAGRLRGAWFAVAGDPIVHRIVDSLEGRSFAIDDRDRSLYHATAAIASNHLAALLGQVERLSHAVGVPMEAMIGLAGGSLANVEAMGAAAALTGPIARGDEQTVGRHRAALPEDELALYDALAEAARRLVRERKGLD